MAKHGGTYSWASIASDASAYQTELDGLLDAIAATSANWSKTKAATIYDTEYVFGVVAHSSGFEVAFAIGAGDNFPMDTSNLGETSQMDDRFYLSVCPQRGSGFNLSNNPRTVDWCTDAGASLFYLFNSADVFGAAREFNWRLDDTAGLLLLEYEGTVGTPLEFAAISGSGSANSLYRSTSIAVGDGYNDFMIIFRAGNLADNDTKYGVIADSNGDYVGGFSLQVDRTSSNATYNPSQPWVYTEAVVSVNEPDGVRGIIDRDWMGWVREGAVSNLTSLQSGAFEHLTDGLVWVDP